MEKFLNDENYPVIDKGKDEHTQLLIGKNMRACQQTMKPIIEKAQTTAEVAHRRVDEINERLLRLDDKETGKVTTLWEDREAVKKYIRNGIIAIIGAMVISQFVTWMFDSSKSSANNEEIIKRAISMYIKAEKAGGI